MIKLDKKLSNAGARYLDSLTLKNYVDIIAGIVVPIVAIIVAVYFCNYVKVLLP